VAELRYLLDSNILIYLLEGSSPAARRRVEACEAGELATSAVAYAEVMWKVPPHDARKRAQVDAVFRFVDVLSFDAKAGEMYRKLPFERHRFDHLIAAHALSCGLTMVTRNTRHFANVPGLRVENWVAS
jgi:tRNA(fMet)-specific endonuclease VapC